MQVNNTAKIVINLDYQKKAQGFLKD